MGAHMVYFGNIPYCYDYAVEIRRFQLLIANFVLNRDET